MTSSSVSSIVLTASLAVGLEADLAGDVGAQAGLVALRRRDDPADRVDRGLGASGVLSSVISAVASATLPSEDVSRPGPPGLRSSGSVVPAPQPVRACRRSFRLGIVRRRADRGARRARSARGRRDVDPAVAEVGDHRRALGRRAGSSRRSSAWPARDSEPRTMKVSLSSAARPAAAPGAGPSRARARPTRR